MRAIAFWKPPSGMVLAAEIGTGDGAGVILGDFSWCLRYHDVMDHFLARAPWTEAAVDFLPPIPLQPGRRNIGSFARTMR